MKKRIYIFLSLIILTWVSYAVTNFTYRIFFKDYDYTKGFLETYGGETFDAFKETSFTVRGIGSNHRISVIASKNSITNNGIWFHVHSKSYELLPKSFTVIGVENLSDLETEALIDLQSLAKTFVKYRIRALDVDKEGNVFIGVEDPSIINLFKSKDENTFPYFLEDKVERKWEEWYIVNCKRYFLQKTNDSQRTTGHHRPD